MKYYYKGKLVRTSKHTYRYGLVNTFNGVIACSANKENLQRQIKSRMNFIEKQIAYFNKHIEEGHNKEFLQEQIENKEEVKNWKIVELEAK